MSKFLVKKRLNCQLTFEAERRVGAEEHTLADFASYIAANWREISIAVGFIDLIPCDISNQCPNVVHY